MAVQLVLELGRARIQYEIEGRIHGNKQKFDVGDKIAQGGNAVVYNCQDSIYGEEYAVKFQIKNQGKMKTRFENELNLLREARHEHLVEYIDEGVCSAFSRKRGGGYENIPFVIMRLGGNNLQEFLEETKEPISYDIYVGQMRGLIQGLGHLHQFAIHRDIKPSNILVSGEVWMLSDYGLCSFVKSSGEKGITNFDEKIGPNNWMSPEANTKSLGYGGEIGKSSDVYQLAAVFWFIINQNYPGGILDRKDWSGPENLFPPLERALQHDPRRRPQDGEEFYRIFSEAVLSD